MYYESKQFVLKDGRTAVLRNPTADDAPRLLDYMLATAGETEFVLRYPEECRMTEAQERAFLEGALEDPDRMMLSCFVDGELAGNCSIQFETRQKFRHRASVAIALYQRFWGLGIGTAMFDVMTETARKRGVMQLELDYIEGNDRARALYEKVGFVEVARHPDAIRLKDGSMRQLVFMIKKL